MAGVGGWGGVKGGWWLERERPGGEGVPLGGYVVVRCRVGNSRGDYPPVALIGKAAPLSTLRAHESFVVAICFLVELDMLDKTDSVFSM